MEGGRCSRLVRRRSLTDSAALANRAGVLLARAYFPSVGTHAAPARSLVDTGMLPINLLCLRISVGPSAVTHHWYRCLPSL
jgi:hypothetical protein